jgi:prepilin-type processing-associated H-X9-DG protein
MRRGFTVIELIAIIFIAIVIVVVLLPPLGKPRINSPRNRDSTHIRAIAQSMVVWANNNNGEYPLPSAIDVSDTTVADKGRAKDTTASIISMLIFNGHISPDTCINPAEANTGNIQRDEDYIYDSPQAAVDPSNALWDPAFSADFTNPNISNFSYAHLQPSGTRGVNGAAPTGRLLKWRDTFDPREAVLGNRSPELSAVNISGKPTSESSYSSVIKNPASNTFLIHGGRSTWEGNIAFNDGHVEFITKLSPFKPSGAKATPSYNTAAGPRLDTIFFDEPDDIAQTNTFLGIFTTAGEKPADFKAIWD